MNVHIRLESRIQLDVGVLRVQVTESFERNIGSEVPELTDGELIFIERVKSPPFATIDVPPVPQTISVGRTV